MKVKKSVRITILVIILILLSFIIRRSRIEKTIVIGFSDAEVLVDGIDDEIEINRAIEKSKQVILKEGNYSISGSIILNKNNFVLEGENASLFFSEDKDEPIIVASKKEFYDYRNSLNNLTIKNLNLFCYPIKEKETWQQTNDKDGIRINADNSIVENNFIIECNEGIWLIGDNNTIQHNTAVDSPTAYGIELSFGSSYNLIFNNTCSDNFKNAFKIHNMLQKPSSYNKIFNNTFVNTKAGYEGNGILFFDEAEYNEIAYNNISNNFFAGVHIESASGNHNYIHDNLFIGNSLPYKDEGTNNTFSENIEKEASQRFNCSQKGKIGLMLWDNPFLDKKSALAENDFQFVCDGFTNICNLNVFVHPEKEKYFFVEFPECRRGTLIFNKFTKDGKDYLYIYLDKLKDQSDLLSGLESVSS